MDEVLEQVIRLAHQVGREDLEFVLPSEGVVSARTGDDTFVTSGLGRPLASLTPSDLVHCELEAAAALSEMQFLRGAELLDELAGLRTVETECFPGMDASLHAWLLLQENVNFVIQANPIACMQVLCSPSGQTFSENRMFLDEIRDTGSRSIFVPFTDIGVGLAREVRSRVAVFYRKTDDRMPAVILLQNFGVLTLGTTAEQAWSTLRMVEKAARVLTGASRLGGVVFLPQPLVRRLESDLLDLEPDLEDEPEE